MTEMGMVALVAVWACLVCGSASAEAERHATVEWVLTCRNSDGGFGSFPGDISAIRPTACAVEALQSLGVAVPDAEKVAEYVARQQKPDGTFLGRQWGTRWTDQSTLVNSHYAMRALRALGHPVSRREELVTFILSRQRPDGAFLEDLYPEREAPCREAFYAIDALGAVGAQVPRSSDLVRFLHYMQTDEIRHDGGFMNDAPPDWEAHRDLPQRSVSSVGYRDPGPEDTRAIPAKVGYTNATYFAIAALSLLGSGPPDRDAAVKFLCSQQHTGGGFLTGMGSYGAFHDATEGRMSDTYRALAALRLLAGGSDETAWRAFLSSGQVDTVKCAAWIQSCQNPDGGFARRLDSISRPSDMESTYHAVAALTLLGKPVLQPERGRPPHTGTLPADVKHEHSSPYFQPDQPGQALYLHRIVAPIRSAYRTDEATALGLMHWAKQHIVFATNYRNEAALIIEDETSNCGGISRCLTGLLEAAGIPARFLMVQGHCVTEAHIDGRWCLLDPELDGAFRDEDGRLYSAFDVHTRHQRGLPEVTTFGDWRYQEYTVCVPLPGEEERELQIGRGDTASSPAVLAAYPELARAPGSP